MRVHEVKGSQTTLMRKQLIKIKGTEDVSQDITFYGNILWTEDHTRRFFAAKITGRYSWKLFAIAIYFSKQSASLAPPISSANVLILLYTSSFLCLLIMMKNIITGPPLDYVTPSAVKRHCISDYLHWGVLPADICVGVDRPLFWIFCFS